MPKDRYPGTALTDAINRRLALTILSLIPVAAAAPAMAEPAVSLQDIIGASERLPEATIYVAREVITMDPARPRAEAVAVVQGRIAAVGSRADIEKLAETQDYRIDETFRDKVLIAGFVEQHVHPVLSSLTMMSNAVISIEDWDTAQGFSAAVRDPATYEARLKEALAAFDKASGSTFLTWGYHHYFHGQELSRTYLDKLAPDFPVIVWHRSCMSSSSTAGPWRNSRSTKPGSTAGQHRKRPRAAWKRVISSNRAHLNFWNVQHRQSQRLTE